MPAKDMIQDPLGLVAQLFDEHMKTNAGSVTDFDPSSHFSTLFEQPDQYQIPSLNQVPASSLNKHSLVRFRCMLQDTGLGQEMYVSVYKKHENGTDKTLCYRYTDDLVDMESNRENTIPTDHLCERSIVYCVSPPGETLWTKQAFFNASDIETTLDQLSLEQKKRPTPPTLGQKFPLPNTDHISAIVKFYDESESLRVGQLVDVIGVLGSTFSMMEASEDQDQFDAHLAHYKNTTVLHAITYKPVDHTTLTPFAKTQLEDIKLQSRDVRGPLLDYIATSFGDDKLVAEFVLLQLLSKVSTQRHGLKIGQFCLNISNCLATDTPPKAATPLMTLSNPSSQAVSHMISTLVPHQVAIPLSVETLNKSRFTPRSVNEDLLSGVLQLAPGTHVLVDESELSEGQLVDTGVRNMQALINVIQHQTLTYAFPYSQFDFDTDLGFLTLSTGKSLLPYHCTLPLKLAYALDQNQAENRAPPSKQQLDVFRMYLQAAKHADYEIPEFVSQYIQDDFVKERKQAAEQNLTLPSQEDLMLRMNLCRLVALSFGESVLTKANYDYTVRLDHLRKARIAEFEQAKQATK